MAARSEETTAEERTDSSGDEEPATECASQEKAWTGPGFPFPVFFLSTAQYPYVMKRVRQLNRQAMLGFQGDYAPGQVPPGGQRK